MSNEYRQSFTALPEHIDENEHVNNAVWVRWMEELAGKHWDRDGLKEHRDAYAWLVTRHEIDYRGNVREGAQVSGVTQILDPPRGARFDRHFTFTDVDDRVLVRAKTTWAMMDKASGKLMRVPADVAAPFMPRSG